MISLKKQINPAYRRNVRKGYAMVVTDFNYKRLNIYFILRFRITSNFHHKTVSINNINRLIVNEMLKEIRVNK